MEYFGEVWGFPNRCSKHMKHPEALYEIEGSVLYFAIDFLPLPPFKHHPDICVDLRPENLNLTFKAPHDQTSRTPLPRHTLGTPRRIDTSIGQFTKPTSSLNVKRTAASPTPAHSPAPTADPSQLPTATLPDTSERVLAWAPGQSSNPVLARRDVGTEACVSIARRRPSHVGRCATGPPMPCRRATRGLEDDHGPSQRARLGCYAQEGARVRCQCQCQSGLFPDE